MKRLSIILLGALLGVAKAEPVTEIQEVKIWGGVRDSLNQNSAPQSVSKESLEAFKYTDVNRALKQAPGIYVREEEGLGLRPNIGLRGTNPDRSKKIVILEDGVLIGPAPYSAPAAYYTPAMNHTESLEVYKGFSAVTYGPNSVGGAINYISRSISPQPHTWFEVIGGSFNTLNVKAEHSSTTAWGGYLINASRRQSDGFKELDGGGFTGYYQNDALGKLRVNLPGSNGRQHDLEFKFGYAQEDSNETYLGITEDHLFESPNRRYRASAKDEMTWEHFTGQLDHNLQLSDTAFVKTSLYRHDFHRSWYRLDKFNDTNIPSLRDILLNPSTGNNPIYAGILRGEQDSSVLGGNGELVVFNNHRVFFSQGLQTQYYNEFNWGPVENRLTLGARLHEDQIERNHTYDLYEMTSGQMLRTSANLTGAKNKEHALARLLSYKYDLSYGKWLFTHAGRYEEVDFEFDNALTGDSNKRSDSAFMPGIAILRSFSDTMSARVSANQAVTLAGLDPTGKEKREEAWIYETGFTYFKDDYSPQFDLVYFYNDYKNLTGTCTSSTGCSTTQLDQQFNGGQAEIQGVEARYAQAFQWDKVVFPVQFNATWIHAAFDNSFSSTSPEWGIGQVANGDPLPYVPQWQYNLVLGTQYGKWSQEMAIIYQGKMYSQSAQADRREIDAYGIIDWRASYSFSDQASLFVLADNILNKTYVSSLNPFGYRPGKPQSFGVGFNYSF